MKLRMNDIHKNKGRRQYPNCHSNLCCSSFDESDAFFPASIECLLEYRRDEHQVPGRNFYMVFTIYSFIIISVVLRRRKLVAPYIIIPDRKSGVRALEDDGHFAIIVNYMRFMSHPGFGGFDENGRLSARTEAMKEEQEGIL